jgi:type I site-specific restriction-modification system R (restriction) subunit
VLANYTPVKSYYKLIKTIEDDPEFDVKKAQKKLRRFVEGHEHAIRLKAEIMVDHFHEQVIAKGKIGGQARAMVVTSGIERAILYYHAIQDYLMWSISTRTARSISRAKPKRFCELVAFCPRSSRTPTRDGRSYRSS